MSSFFSESSLNSAYDFNIHFFLINPPIVQLLLAPFSRLTGAYYFLNQKYFCAYSQVYRCLLIFLRLFTGLQVSNNFKDHISHPKLL